MPHVNTVDGLVQVLKRVKQAPVPRMYHGYFAPRYPKRNGVERQRPDMFLVLEMPKQLLYHSFSS